MQFIQTAAYDPIFWLHHSYVDKIWAERQDNQGLQQMTKSELEDIVLRPFEGKYTHCAKLNMNEKKRASPNSTSQHFQDLVRR